MIEYQKDGFSIRQLSIDDGENVYQMLKRIGKEENHFQNPVHDMTFQEYKEWLKEQDDWANDRNLPKGYSGQTSLWMIVDGDPIGYGKIRHTLNENSRTVGGNIGYAIDPIHRCRGYATILLGELIKIATSMGIEEKLLSVEKFNYTSKHVIEKNGGYVFMENDKRWFFHINQ